VLLNLLNEYVKEIRELRSPTLPVCIFLAGTLSFVAYKDKHLYSLIQPELQSAAQYLHLGADCLYTFLSLFALPCILLVIIGEHPKNYGLSFGRARLALPIFVVLLAGLTLLGLVVANMSSFKDHLSPSPPSIAGWVSLFISCIVYMWGWEFITRGFLLLGLKRFVGVYAVYIQLIPSVILHLGKPSFELYGSIVFGLFFGFYAYLVDSFIYCALSHAYFAFVITVFVSLA